MTDKKKTQQIHHIVVPHVLRLPAGLTSSFQLSESFYNCLLNIKGIKLFLEGRSREKCFYLLLKLKGYLDDLEVFFEKIPENE